MNEKLNSAIQTLMNQCRTGSLAGDPDANEVVATLIRARKRIRTREEGPEQHDADAQPTITVQLVDNTEQPEPEHGAVLGIFNSGLIDKGGYVDRRNRDDATFARALLNGIQALSNDVRAGKRR